MRLWLQNNFSSIAALDISCHRLSDRHANIRSCVIEIATLGHSSKQSRGRLEIHDSSWVFFGYKKLLGRTETRTRDMMCFQSLRTVWHLPTGSSIDNILSGRRFDLCILCINVWRQTDTSVQLLTTFITYHNYTQQLLSPPVIKCIQILHFENFISLACWDDIMFQSFAASFQ